MLDGVRVTGGAAHGDNDHRLGGGLFANHVAPRLVDVTFEGNTALDGAGAFVRDEAPVFERVRFVGNVADGQGGGLMVAGGASPVLDAPVFQDNVAAEGGGMYVLSSSPQLQNCVFTGNTSLGPGGALYAEYGSARLTHCTLYANVAASSGGGIYDDNFSATALENSILWGSVPDAWASSGDPAPHYSDVAGWVEGEGNIHADPRFIDAAAGDLRLAADSPCLDAADGDRSPATDADGNPRWDVDTVDNTGVGDPPYADLGAFERQQ